MRFGHLLDPRIAVSELPIAEYACSIHAEEAAAISSAVPQRRREFVTGRLCARIAMARLGHRPLPVFRGADRAPIWPLGHVGSITHTGELCAAAVARKSDGFLGVGIDLEPAEPLPADYVDTVCSAGDLASLNPHGGADTQLLARAVFSIKEAVYKCQYAVSRTFIDFHDVAVAIDPDRTHFRATLQRAVAPFERGRTFDGALAIGPDYIAAALSLRR